jgi:hypothetical protein
MARKTTSMERGGKIQTDYPRDDSSHNLPNMMGCKMGGSTTNLAHSLEGASVRSRQDGTGKDKKDRFD